MGHLKDIEVTNFMLYSMKYIEDGTAHWNIDDLFDGIWLGGYSGTVFRSAVGS